MKYIKSIICLALVCVFTSSLNAQFKKGATVEGITEYSMENGLKVLLFPDNSSQTITVNITYLVGSRHEGYGEKGMAHLLEHMVFKGTPNHKDIPKELSSHGARPNGTTYYDRTNYFETFNATTENLDWALDLEADRMVNSFISKEDLESEFTVVRNEFESGENNPTRVMIQKLADAAFMWHNYGKSTIGNRSDIERVPIENLQAFYKKFYRPDNAVLMVTGKFDEKETLDLIGKKFGAIKRPAIPVRDSYTEEPAQDGERFVNVSRTGESQIVAALYHTPAGSHEDYAGISLIEDIMTNAPSGRLYKSLVDKQKASDMFAFSPFTKEPGFMYLQVNIPSDKNADEVQEIVRNTFDNFKPITQEELDRAKANTLKNIDQISRNSGFLGTYMSEFIGAGDWRLSFIQRDRIEAMTVDKINAIAQKYFIPTNRTVGRFIPTKEPKRVTLEHTEGLSDLVSDYKGREDMGTGEAFDVSFDNIEKRLERGKLLDHINYGLIDKENRGDVVTVNFAIRNGKVDDFMNMGMIPSFTASMLNKGTASKTRQQIQDELSKLKSSVFFSARGGNVYAYVTSTKKDLMASLALMEDMLKNPTFDQAELDKLKTERLAGIEQNKTEPGFLASFRLGQINNHFPKGHPNYAMSIAEQEEAIKAVTVSDMKNFHKKYYGLGYATLVGIGTMDKSAVVKYFETGFKDMKGGKYEEIKSPYSPTKAVSEEIITPDKKNATTYGTLGIKVSQYDEDYAALNIAGTILGGGFLNSRIANRLRQQDGVSYGAGASVNVDSDKIDGDSSFFVYAIYNPSNLAKIKQGFSEEIDRFIKDGITQEELENAVNGWVQAQNVSRAKDNELASVINNNLYYDRDMDFHKKIEANVKSLTVQDVNAAIKKYLKSFDQWTVVHAGDFKE
ncbi:pitrilysin family protein [uncultured Dokdonia sp.]|uniref:M16 family metallopeptidase n=1 Tax=uncultured Dokdonia sp. TaxID=575653 RepID=UPI00262EF1D1|nr:pitrilysin family protein [uncultured Dokdonia sp.]